MKKLLFLNPFFTYCLGVVCGFALGITVMAEVAGAADNQLIRNILQDCEGLGGVAEAEEKQSYTFARFCDSGVTPGWNCNPPLVDETFVGWNSWKLDQWVKDHPDYEVTKRDTYESYCGPWEIITVQKIESKQDKDCAEKWAFYYRYRNARNLDGSPFFFMPDCPEPKTCEDRIKALEKRVFELEDKMFRHNLAHEVGQD